MLTAGGRDQADNAQELRPIAEIWGPYSGANHLPLSLKAL
jgi:hypothetical protein